MKHGQFSVPSGSALLAGESTVGGEPTLMFLHAGVADRRSWRSTIGALAGAFATVSYDRRGFGETVGPPESYSNVADLLALLDALELDRVWLVGNSQGGRIALDAALAAPERVSGLVLVAPAVSGAPELTEDEPQWVLDLWQEAEAAEQSGDLALLNRLETHLWLDGPASPENRVVGEVRDLALAMNAVALAATVGDEVEPPSAFVRLGEIGVPTLLLWGDLDVQPLQVRCAELARMIPGARAEVMTGVAHLPQLEKPNQFAALLRGFVESSTG